MASDVTPAQKKISVEDFEFGDTLGAGAYGDVVLATNKANNKKYAAKKIEKKLLLKEDKTKYAVTERDILTKCNHPGIIKLFFSFRDPTHLYYVLELAPNGELLGKIRKFKTFALPVAQFYAAELVLALEYLHTQGIIHRDLKPENVLLSEKGHIKLTDFGTSKQVGKEKDARSGSFVGTAEYISPELLDTENPIAYKSSDLWALGVILYQMITGRLPFRGKTDLVTFEQIQKSLVTYPTNIPEAAKDLISKLLVKDPDARLGAQDYADLKSHDFFKGIEWETLFKQTPPEFVSSDVEWQWPAEEGQAEAPKAAEKASAATAKPQAETDFSWVNTHLNKDEKVVEVGLVNKIGEESTRSRVLALTSTGRVLSLSPKNQELRSQFELTLEENSFSVKVSGSAFEVALAKKTYKFDAVDKKPESWKKAFDSLLPKAKETKKAKTKDKAKKPKAKDDGSKKKSKE